ncbi:MAG: UDP-N-acetylmuramate--L-alanine ligase [Oscillospiraceae bacterium]
MRPNLQELLQSPQKIHFVGVGGSGTYPLVQILLPRGHKISGSDVNETDIIGYERSLGVNVIMRHQAENVHGADLVVYSAAIASNNPELAEAERLGIPAVERSVMLAYVASLYKRPLCVSGTHGKTTTTAMATQILEMAGLDPAAVIGGKLPYINGYGKGGNGDAMVLEACEYHNTFLELIPETAVLLNIDNDHLEFFGDMEHLMLAFRQFCAAATGAVLYNGDDERCSEVVAPLSLPCISFGFEENCQLRAVNAHEYRPALWAFDVEWDGVVQGEVRLLAPGRHNVYNALAAYGGARRLGASHQQCADGLLAFGGAGRRMEVLGTNKGITIADDYAHHPAELKATLSTAKELDYKEVWAVFQPYTYSRTQLLLQDFADVLPIADHVVMTAIMGGREQAEDYTIRTSDLAVKIPGSVWFETQEETADYVMRTAKEGDLVITLGCGDIYKCARMMMNTK